MIDTILDDFEKRGEQELSLDSVGTAHFRQLLSDFLDALFKGDVLEEIEKAKSQIAELSKKLDDREADLLAERAKVAEEIFKEIRTMADKEMPEDTDYWVYNISEMILVHIEAKYTEEKE